MKNYKHNYNSDTKDNQLSFEESFISLEEFVEDECNCTGGEDEPCTHPNCSVASLGEQYELKGYREIMIDEDGNFVKNFIGREK